MKEYLNKRLNKKGFTLIELLAVIVILAVLILLALPNVLKIMDNARKSVFEVEVRNMLKAAETKAVERAFVPNQVNPMYFISFDGYTEPDEICDDGTFCLLDIDLKSGYDYFIMVKRENDGSLKYRYFIANEKYYAKSYEDDDTDEEGFADLNSEINVLEHENNTDEDD